MTHFRSPEWEHRHHRSNESLYRNERTPTIALTHSFYIPEGDSWVVVHRQFYVSGVYNSEQALAGFLPLQKGTLVVYTSRISTDQVGGLGGGTKRSIGSKLLSSQLETLYQKMRAEQEKKSGS